MTDKQPEGSIWLTRKQVVEAISMWLDEKGYNAEAHDFTDRTGRDYDKSSIEVHVRFRVSKENRAWVWTNGE